MRSKMKLLIHIVLCPHHHKVIHYENGGFGGIVKNNLNVYVNILMFSVYHCC